MAEPGDKGGDCLRCGGETVQVGVGVAVVGTWCRRCDFVVVMDYHDPMSVSDANEADFSEYDYTEPAAWGPDPNP